MNKRLIVIALTVLCAFSLPAQEVVNSSNQEETQEMGIHPYKTYDQNTISPKLAHWMLTIGAGFNGFDGDFKSEEKHACYAPTINVGASYSFNPMWGLGLEYKFNMYRVTGVDNSYTADVLLKGLMHQVDAYVSFDIFSAFFPQNKHKLFCLDVIAGGGFIYYKNSVQYPNVYGWRKDNATGNQYQYLMYHTGDKQEAESMDKYKSYGVFMVGADFQFNVARSIALGLKATYNMYTKDEVDGRARGNNNDGMVDLTLSLRWKLGAKYHSHVRNMNTLSMYSLVRNADAAQVHKTDTLYISSRDTIVVQMTQPTLEDYSYVYFENNQSTLDNQSLVTIQQAANRMMRDDSLCVVVVGYCDNTGSANYNKQLGTERAKNVSDELVNEYGLDPDRVLTVGRGIIRGKRSEGAYMPNRRVEMRFMSLENFEKEKQKYISEQEEMTKLKENGTEIIVEDNMTLSKLAREKYNNTNCWVYIYLANQDVLSSANSLSEGMTIILPELNAKQKGITRERAAELYRDMK